MGEKLFEDPEPTLTGYEESTEEWKFVERILSKDVVPPPPEHASYPTPSGWVPPKGKMPSVTGIIFIGKGKLINYFSAFFYFCKAQIILDFISVMYIERTVILICTCN